MIKKKKNAIVNVSCRNTEPMNTFVSLQYNSNSWKLHFELVTHIATHINECLFK